MGFYVTTTHILYVEDERPAYNLQIYTEEGGSSSHQDFRRNWPVCTFVRGGGAKHYDIFVVYMAFIIRRALFGA